MSAGAGRSTFALALGLFGALNLALGAWLWRAVAHGPGDDNPMALVGFVQAAIALVPTAGLAFGLGDARWSRGVAWKIWAALAVPAMVPLLPLFVIVLGMFTHRP